MSVHHLHDEPVDRIEVGPGECGPGVTPPCSLGWRLTAACWAAGAIVGLAAAVLIDRLIPRRS